MSASLSDQAPEPFNGLSIFDTLVDDLQVEVTSDGKSRISQVRDLVDRMNDLERLLLYLQLPNGVARTDANALAVTGALQLSNQLEQSQAFTWIQSHLEEDPSICLRKDEVYNDYRSYCDSHGQKALNTADFGKVMKRAFPNVKPRRLGQRGQSKYCYGGLRKKADLPHPVMPDLSMAELDCPGGGGGASGIGCGGSGGSNPTGDDAISGEIILEWAQKILGSQFRSLRHLAEHLVTNVYVNSRSPAAMTLVSNLQANSQRRMPVSQLIGLRPDVKQEASAVSGRANASACWSPDSLNSSGGPLDTSSLASPAPPSRPLLMQLPQRITKKTFRNPPLHAHHPPPHQQPQQIPPPMLHHPPQHPLKQPPMRLTMASHLPQSPNVPADTSAIRSMQQPASIVAQVSVPLPRPSSSQPKPQNYSALLNPSPGKKVCAERRFQPLGASLNAQLLEQEVSADHYIPMMSPLPGQQLHRGECSPAPHWGPPAAAVSPQPPPPHLHHHQAAYGIEPISLPPALGRSPSPQFPPVSPEQYLPALPRIGTSPLPSSVTRPLARRSPVTLASPASRSTMSSTSSPQQPPPLGCYGDPRSVEQPDSGKTFTTLTSRSAAQQPIDPVDAGVGSSRGEENLVSSTTNPHRNLHTPTGLAD